MAEWSKALDLGSSLFGGTSSNLVEIMYFAGSVVCRFTAWTSDTHCRQLVALLDFNGYFVWSGSPFFGCRLLIPV